MSAPAFVDTNVLVSAALISGCRRLYTEDLQAGFRIEKLEVINPFTES